jgi:serine protease
LSWGARGYSSTTLAAIQYAISKGAVVATAAANHAEEISATNPWFPAVYAKDLDGLISVAATDANPASAYVKCGFSNVSNSFVEIAAPGCDTTVQHSTVGLNGILSTMRMRTNQGYGYMPGTSMATPHIAAAAALVFAQRWSIGKRPTPAEVESLLMAGSRSQSNLSPYVVGGRHLDLDLLMTSLTGTVVTPVDPPPCQ